MTPDRDELEHLLREDAAAPGGSLDGVLAALHRETDEPPGVRGRLRSLPTPTRVGIALGGLTAATLAGALTGVRADLHGADLTRVVVTSAVLVLSAGVLVVVSLRSLAARPLPLALHAFAWVGIGLPLGLALVPGWWGPAGAGSEGGWGPCLVAGLVVASAASGVTLGLERSDRAPLWRLVAAAGAGGLAALAALGVHCPSGHPEHVLLGHAIEGVLVGVTAWALDRAYARLRR